MIKSRIEKFTSYLINKYQTNDPFTICDHLNIKIIIAFLGKSEGYYIHHNNVSLVYINSTLEHITSRAICAHELGHALLHTKTNIRFMTECTFFSQNKYERDANLFASFLLLNDLRKRLPFYEGCSYNEIAATEDVPEEFVKLQFEGR